VERFPPPGRSISGVTGPLRLRDDALEWRALEGEVLALDSATQRYLATNRSGAVLWAALAAGSTRDELVAVLVGRFDVGEEEAGRDVDGFLGAIEAQGLLIRAT
jgi:Coenzyme PQQ synthesis protein D (PqqD)